ncbi:hypothetical protein DM02DRAFT_691108 [Periconia macrospinosa]|uniref:BRCT domain-containing protein n=1 Tax=Periconia macrospinosa TaxID=97972 RepID=A0A2V1DCG1_9PLEO|nr:hypothetical protein DM02DRAFT_691108 [Periconia macrospinosa]
MHAHRSLQLVAAGTSQMPLAGAILCCTSISPEQRTELGVIGAQMGAVIKLDLTSDVTHLVVGNINSAKYRYVAKSRDDVKVLDPQWLAALRNVWMEGGDVDVAALEEQYRLPTFYGLKICLTGFDDPEQRRLIQDTVSQNGGEYHGDLTKSVSHLIAASPAGKKYEHAITWGLKVVTWEWFQQSVERGMVLDEELYNPTMPVEDRGKGAWERRENASPVLGKRIRDISHPDPINPLRRKLRRSASTRLGTQSDALWAGITAGSFEQKKTTSDDWTETSIAKPELLPADAASTAQASATHADADSTEDPASRSRRPFVDDDDGIFANRLAFPYGFDQKKTKILCDHLEGNGAAVVLQSSELSNFAPDDLTGGFLVVPHDTPMDLTVLPEEAGKLSLVTNWWVERCVHAKRLVDPAENVLCRPFNKLNISGFPDLTINVTGFSGIELLQVTRAVALFGATYDDFLSPKITVLVCNTRTPNPDKLNFATEKSIPAVHAAWLWECIRSGHKQPYDTYLLTPAKPQLQRPRPKPKPKSRASLPEVPTAPLSEEDSLKLQTKIRNGKAAPKTLGGPRRPGALELSISGPPTPTSTTGSSSNSTANTNHTGENGNNELHMAGDGTSSLPLQDINPSVNSPHRPSTSTTHHTEEDNVPTKPAPAPRQTRRTRQPTPDSFETDPPSLAPADDNVEPSVVAEEDPKPQETNYSDMMSKLLANRKTSTPGDNEEEKARRKRRPLGRAQSSRSNASTADDLSLKHNSTGETDTAEGRTVIEEEEQRKAEPEPFNITQASQELGWDSPGAQRARENMIRAMGGKIKEKKSNVEAAGVVADKTDVAAVGGRATRRRKG